MPSRFEPRSQLQQHFMNIFFTEGYVKILGNLIIVNMTTSLSIVQINKLCNMILDIRDSKLITLHTRV